MQDKIFVPKDKMLVGFVFGVLTFWLFSLSMNGVVDKLIADPSLPLTIEEINLGISITALFSGCFIVVAGGIADKVGQMKVVYTGFAFTIVGSLLLIFANSFEMFVGGRILQGLSAACIMSATLALIKKFYDGAARQRALSFWSIGSWGGGGFCAFFGDIVASNLGWRTIFIFSIAFAIIGLILVFGTPDSKAEKTDKKSRFDFLGLFSFLITLLAVNLFVVNANRLGWANSTMLTIVMVGIIAFLVFYVVGKTRKDKAFIDFALFANRGFTGASLSNFLLNMTVGVISIVPFYIRDGLGFEYYGWLTIGYAVTVLAMIRVGELILRKIGAKKPMLLGTTVTGTGILMMSLTFLDIDTYFIVVAAGFFFFGLGLGFYATPSTDTAISNSPLEKAGVASGIYKMASSLGGAFGAAISIAVYKSLIPDNSTITDIQDAAGITLLVNVGFCLLSILAIMLLVPSKKTASNSENQTDLEVKKPRRTRRPRQAKVSDETGDVNKSIAKDDVKIAEPTLQSPKVE